MYGEHYSSFLKCVQFNAQLIYTMIYVVPGLCDLLVVAEEFAVPV